MFANLFGSLLTGSSAASQTGGGKAKAKKAAGKKKAAPRGSKENGAGRPFLAYEKLTVEELRAKARKYGITGYSAMSKKQLIAALRKK